MYFYYVLIHYIHIMLILKLLCVFRNTTVHNLYEHYSSTNSHAIVSVILSSSPWQCHNVLVAHSCHPYTVTEDVAVILSFSRGCFCHPLLLPCLCRGTLLSHHHRLPVLVEGTSVILFLLRASLSPRHNPSLSLSQAPL